MIRQIITWQLALCQCTGLANRWLLIEWFWDHANFMDYYCMGLYRMTPAHCVLHRLIAMWANWAICSYLWGGKTLCVPSRGYLRIWQLTAMTVANFIGVVDSSMFLLTPLSDCTYNAHVWHIESAWTSPTANGQCWHYALGGTWLSSLHSCKSYELTGIFLTICTAASLCSMHWGQRMFRLVRFYSCNNKTTDLAIMVLIGIAG